MATGIHAGIPSASPVRSAEESFRAREECVRRASYSASWRARGLHEDENDEDDERPRSTTWRQWKFVAAAFDAKTAFQPKHATLVLERNDAAKPETPKFSALLVSLVERATDPHDAETHFCLDIGPRIDSDAEDWSIYGSDAWSMGWKEVATNLDCAVRWSRHSCEYYFWKLVESFYFVKILSKIILGRSISSQEFLEAKKTQARCPCS